MTSTEVLGFAGVIAFVAFIGVCLRTTMKWGEETKKREEEYEKAASVDVIDEHGQPLTIVRSRLLDQPDATPDGNTTTPA